MCCGSGRGVGGAGGGGVEAVFKGVKQEVIIKEE